MVDRSASISSRHSSDSSFSRFRLGLGSGRRRNRYRNRCSLWLPTTMPHHSGTKVVAFDTKPSCVTKTTWSKHSEYAFACPGSLVTSSLGPLISMPIRRSAITARSMRARPEQTSISSTRNALVSLRTQRGIWALMNARISPSEIAGRASSLSGEIS